MIRTILAVALLALGASVVAAQDPIAARKALMKDNGAQLGAIRQMADGKRPFDLDAAKKAFAAIAASAPKAKALFPDNSKSGDTAALPTIWEKKAEFEALFDKIAADAKAAEAATKDLDTMKAQLGVVAKNCGGCHGPFRKKAS